MSITLNIPTEAETRLRREFPDLERHLLEGYAVDAYRCGELSSGQVGELLGMDGRMAAIRFLSERGVYPGYDIEDLEADRAAHAKLRGRLEIVPQ